MDDAHAASPVPPLLLPELEPLLLPELLLPELLPLLLPLPELLPLPLLEPLLPLLLPEPLLPEPLLLLVLPEPLPEPPLLPPGVGLPRLPELLPLPLDPPLLVLPLLVPPLLLACGPLGGSPSVVVVDGDEAHPITHHTRIPAVVAARLIMVLLLFARRGVHARGHAPHGGRTRRSRDACNGGPRVRLACSERARDEA